MYKKLIAEPSNVKESKPIVCRTVLYKIISKVFNCQDENIIPHIISENQAGFIPGTKIADKHNHGSRTG